MTQTQTDISTILNLMKQNKIYWQTKNQLLTTIIKKNNHEALSQQTLNKILFNSHTEQKLKGLISNCLQKSMRRLPIQKDPLPQIEIYRQKWSQMISRQFNAMASKIAREEQYDEEDQSVNYIYDPSTLLQYLTSIKPKIPINLRESTAIVFPYQILKVPKYNQIRQKYIFLLNNQNIIGGEMDLDLKQRQRKAKKIIQGQSIATQIQNYLCLGCINGQRPGVYRKYFECFYQHNGKRVQYALYQRIWKQMIKSDSKQILKNPAYFVFKEAILKIFQIFICDKQLGHMVKIRQLSNNEVKLDKFAPIHGTLPCKSFANYIAPFCFTSTSPEECYQLFRHVYTNYIINLHTVSSLSDSILSLCIIFQQLLFITEKKIIAKFQQLDLQPLKLVFPMIFYCFIGYVTPQQFFMLLDRIIGTKSLDILPLYAVSLLYKQKTAILQAKNEGQIQQILQDSMFDDVCIQTIRQYLKCHL